MDIDEILGITAHRPWPLPDAPWIMRQSWVDLLFAHWPVESGALRETLPPELDLDTFDGTAWIGVVPFAIRNLGVRSLPGVPTATDFLELNVRTYVRCNGRPGVYFYTLEASSQLAVTAARTAFGLPYHHARMHAAPDGDWIAYRSDRDDGTASFEARYRPAGPAAHPVAGTLEHFLTERYALMNVNGGEVTHVEIHHPPWLLQLAEAEIRTNTIVGEAGIAVDNSAPLLHFSRQQNMVNWALADGCPGPVVERP
jgi:uncharacterized protein